MIGRLQARARGFTLIELLIVIAIIGILIAAIAVAVTKAKEIAWQNSCGSNMKQVMEAMNTFHEDNGCYPTYNGVFPVRGSNAAPGDVTSANAREVYGSWFTHLLPYTENKGLHDVIREQCANFQNHASATMGGGTLISPAVPGYWKNKTTGLPETPPVNPGEPPTIPNPAYTGSITTNTGNGYSFDAGSGISPTIANPNYRDTSNHVFVSTVPAVYGPPGAPYSGPIGVQFPEHARTIFKVLICPSDPPADGNVGDGLVYKLSSKPWGQTNYLANWNAITNGNPTLGWQAPPGRRELVDDGPGNTIYLGEAYAWCEGKGRTALLAWHQRFTNYGGVHNFGLTFNFTSITFNGNTTSTTLSNGVPNPDDSGLNFGFQIQPQATKQGQGGCMSLTVQSPHSSMNVVMGDASVRRVREGITLDQWRRLLLPKDGGANVNLD
jgi:prepilin-type N-terminal cleavage/methylation domain-containing protein